MPRLVGVKQAWTFIIAYAFALASLIFGPTRAFSILEAHPHASTPYLLAVVGLGVGALTPIVLLTAWAYARSDEYERHGMLLSHSVAFGVGLLAMAALDLLARTDLMPRLVWAPRWWTMVCCWIAAFVIVQTARRRDA